MLPKDNPESWKVLNDFIAEYPDDSRWVHWKQMVRIVVSGLEAAGLASHFRAGMGMHHIIFSTAESHRLRFEPRVTLEFHPKEQFVRVAYGCSNLSFHEPLVEEQVAPSVALSCVLHYLRRLWVETKPDAQIPDALKVA